MRYLRVCLFVLVAGLQVLSAQEFPRGPPGGFPQGPPPGFPRNKCAGPPPRIEKPQECCQIKPMFSEEELTECGFQKVENGEPPHRQGPPDCQKQMCLLKNKDFLNDDDSIKYEAVKLYLDGWVDQSPEFKPAVDAAKEVCMGDNGPPGPPQVCEANRLMFCTGAILFSECPNWKDTEDCKTLKAHIEECRSPDQ